MTNFIKKYSHETSINFLMKAHGENERQNRPEVQVGDAAFRELKVLYPIPASAIQTDPNLKQNPEY